MSKSKKAVALKYSSGQDLAPVVVASGYGHIAEQIIDIAEERGVPVYRDDSAASVLCMLEVGTSIPEELYQVIAAIYCQILSTASGLKGGEVLEEIKKEEEGKELMDGESQTLRTSS